mmetsp:Transcript_2401/g.4152  ORF Transcript_2401/g.4152 Transcript_2401/m.4152 type:complete len:128 (-) Transcript_2401:99-482(-)
MVLEGGLSELELNGEVSIQRRFPYENMKLLRLLPEIGSQGSPNLQRGAQNRILIAVISARISEPGQYVAMRPFLPELGLCKQHMTSHDGIILHQLKLVGDILGVFPLHIKVSGTCLTQQLDHQRLSP